MGTILCPAMGGTFTTAVDSNTITISGGIWLAKYIVIFDKKCYNMMHMKV